MVRDLDKYFRIDAPEIPDQSSLNGQELLDDQVSSQLFRVTLQSRLKWQQAVERFAYYFKREGRYDFPGFHAGEHPDNGNVTAYLISQYGNDSYWIGAACFRTRNTQEWGRIRFLSWIWLHPYCRNQGLLRQLWPKLRELEGDFFPETPLSRVMLHFVREHNQDSRFAYFFKPENREPIHPAEDEEE